MTENTPNQINRRVVVAARPSPAVTEACFRLEEAAVPEPGDGEVLLRNHYLSIDPAMRGWIAEGPNYSPPVPIGDVMRSFAVGEVVRSRNANYREGDFLMGRFGWQDWAVANEDAVDRKVDPAEAPLSANLHLLGMTGLTAYLGLLDVGMPKEGETVVVSTAAGAVGALVGQIAKIKGCRAVGLTGSDEKVADCLESFGYDSAINYKTADDLSVALAEACPDGVDVYYDMTGGPISDAVMDLINVGARIVVVGTMAVPSSPTPMGPRYNRQILVKRAKMQGFLVLDHFDRLDDAARELARWYREGRVTFREDISQGLDTAPSQLFKLLDGRNRGKALVRLISA